MENRTSHGTPYPGKRKPRFSAISTVLGDKENKTKREPKKETTKVNKFSEVPKVPKKPDTLPKTKPPNPTRASLRTLYDSGKGQNSRLIPKNDGEVKPKPPRKPLSASVQSLPYTLRNKDKTVQGSRLRSSVQCLETVGAAKNSKLKTAAYWLAQIRLSESATMHLISLGFFRLALESNAQPLRSIRDYLVAYDKKHKLLLDYGNNAKEVLQKYGLSDVPESSKPSHEEEKAHESETTVGVAPSKKTKIVSNDKVSQDKLNVQESDEMKDDAVPCMESGIQSDAELNTPSEEEQSIQECKAIDKAVISLLHSFEKEADGNESQETKESTSLEDAVAHHINMIAEQELAVLVADGINDQLIEEQKEQYDEQKEPIVRDADMVNVYDIEEQCESNGSNNSGIAKEGDSKEEQTVKECQPKDGMPLSSFEATSYVTQETMQFHNQEDNLADDNNVTAEQEESIVPEVDEVNGFVIDEESDQQGSESNNNGMTKEGYSKQDTPPNDNVHLEAENCYSLVCNLIEEAEEPNAIVSETNEPKEINSQAGLANTDETKEPNVSLVQQGDNVQGPETQETDVSHFEQGDKWNAAPVEYHNQEIDVIKEKSLQALRKSPRIKDSKVVKEIADVSSQPRKMTGNFTRQSTEALFGNMISKEDKSQKMSKSSSRVTELKPEPCPGKNSSKKSGPSKRSDQSDKLSDDLVKGDSRKALKGKVQEAKSKPSKDTKSGVISSGKTKGNGKDVKTMSVTDLMDHVVSEIMSVVDTPKHAAEVEATKNLSNAPNSDSTSAMNPMQDSWEALLNSSEEIGDDFPLQVPCTIDMGDEITEELGNLFQTPPTLERPAKYNAHGSSRRSERIRGSSSKRVR